MNNMRKLMNLTEAFYPRQFGQSDERRIRDIKIEIEDLQKNIDRYKAELEEIQQSIPDGDLSNDDKASLNFKKLATAALKTGAIGLLDRDYELTNDLNNFYEMYYNDLSHPAVIEGLKKGLFKTDLEFMGDDAAKTLIANGITQVSDINSGEVDLYDWV